MFDDRIVFKNGFTVITAEDNTKTEGGAPKIYHIVPESASGEVAPHLLSIEFQSQPFKHGVNGVTNEDLLFVLIDRLRCFQDGPGRCQENEDAIKDLKCALLQLEKRSKRVADK